MLGLNSPRSGRSFATQAEAHQSSAVYYGEHGDWYIVAAVNRDSDTLDESNFEVLQKELGKRAKVERSNHWACGWVDYLIIAPNDKAAIRIALAAKKRADDYPVLNDEHFSELEWNKFHDFAESELHSFEGWQLALTEALDASNSGPGDESAEWAIIESARETLEEWEVLYDSNASCPIDPCQLYLFPADVIPHL